ncbi:MAG: KOW domain-containing RNA-binding protein [Oscillospiraceae bacterium]|nr:KOW domain-containing RNA-binding protein [Oscillospiraceae bacterium]
MLGSVNGGAKDQDSRWVINTADIVISLNGRDGGKRFIVIGTEDEYVLLVDGKGRKIDKPKRKKIKHIKLEARAREMNSRLTEKLISGQKTTNNEIRRALAEFAAGPREEGGM